MESSVDPESWCRLFPSASGEKIVQPIKPKMLELRVGEDNIWAMRSRSRSHHVSGTIDYNAHKKLT